MESGQTTIWYTAQVDDRSEERITNGTYKDATPRSSLRTAAALPYRDLQEPGTEA